MKNDQIFRKTYIDELIRLKNTNYIKVITGVRRSGKSTILNQFMLYLKEIGVNENQILSYDFNDLKLAKLNFENLYDKILSEANKNDINYLFLDEIQEIDNFEKCVISLFENKKIKFDIYISGSNSKMFSENLATLFTGRNLTLKVLPFSFKEFFEYYKDNYLEFNTNEYALAMKRNIFDKYSKFGGLPILLNNLQNVKTLEEQLQQILNDTIVKDVKTRYKIRNIGEFQRIAKYILSETGKEISVLNAVNFIKSNEKFKITHQTIDKYLNYLQEALLIYKAEIYNIKGKNLLKTTAKYYSVDTGVKNVQDNFQTWNSRYTIESIVYIELLRRGYDVFVGKLRIGEIDFVCKRKNTNEIIYIQVTQTLKDGTDIPLWNREIGNLERIHDSFPKILISLEDEDKTLDSGIIIKNLINWLLDI